MELYQAVVMIPHRVNYPDPIRFRAGERVVVGSGDEEYPGWIWTTIESGNQGWAPETYLQISGETGLALRDYEARELSTQRGEPISVEYEVAGWVWAYNQSGAAGWVPLSGIQRKGINL